MADLAISASERFDNAIRLILALAGEWRGLAIIDLANNTWLDCPYFLFVEDLAYQLATGTEAEDLIDKLLWNVEFYDDDVVPELRFDKLEAVYSSQNAD